MRDGSTYRGARKAEARRLKKIWREIKPTRAQVTTDDGKKVKSSMILKKP